MIKNIYKIVMLLMVSTLIISTCGCSLIGEESVPIKDYESSDKSSSEDDEKDEDNEIEWEDALSLANEYMKDMTLEEKIGQLFVVNLELLDDSHGSYYEHRKFTKLMRENISKYHVGGVIMFSKNVKSKEQLIKLNSKLQSSIRTPLFIAVDEEGGDVARIASNEKIGNTKFPSAEEIGKTKDDKYTYNMAKTIGTEIGALGFNVDFAPVADVRTSDLNSEIGNRSFGDDPEKVSEHVSAFVQGLENVGVCSTLKHFPGQGSSTGDTHKNSVDIDSGIAKLRKTDFLPFETGISAGADFIMMSHISVSKVTESSIPASMSDLMMQTILRQEMGYEKIIITDAFDMASIVDNYSSREAAYNAFKGGADIILMPQNLGEAYNEILIKVQSGEITMDRLEDSVLRILAVKIQRGILTEDIIQSTNNPVATATTEPNN